MHGAGRAGREVAEVAAEQALKAIEQWPLEGLPVAAPRLLQAYADAAGFEIRWIAASEGGRLIAVAPVKIVSRRVHLIHVRTVSMAGSGFFDYQRIFGDAAAVPDILAFLRKSARAWGADLVFLEEVVSAHDLPRPARLADKTEIFQPDESGWRRLTKKKRKHQALAKTRSVRVEQYTHDRVNETLLHEIAEVHAERWAYEGRRSLLAQDSRRAVYLSARESALVTVVRADNEILAAHYGLRLDGVVLFHTPAINIKFLDYSPMEVLIYNIACECERRGLVGLDFGLGDENYKTRYSNAMRPVYELLAPSSWRGALVVVAHHAVKGGLLRRAAHARRRIAETKAGFVSALRRKAGRQDIAPREGAAFPNLRLEVFASFEAFVTFCRARHVQPLREDYERYRSGSRHLALFRDGHVAATAWIRPDGDRPGARILFDLSCDPGEKRAEILDAVVTLSSAADLANGFSYEAPLVRLS